MAQRLPSIGHSNYRQIPLRDFFRSLKKNGRKSTRDCLAGAIHNEDENRVYLARLDVFQWLTWDIRPWYNSKKEIGGIFNLYFGHYLYKGEGKGRNSGSSKYWTKPNQVARIGTWEIDTH